MKRLRKKFCKYEVVEFDEKICLNPIRYYHSGEYGGSHTRRPHYHALIFNHAFTDIKLFKKINDIPLFTSKTLTKIWGLGHASVGTITMDSAAYVARYIMKKQYSNKQEPDRLKQHYRQVDLETGEFNDLDPEYSTMSRNIGKEWFLKYQSDVYPKDYVTYRGEKFRPPKFYDRLYSDLEPEKMAKLKSKRIIIADKNKANQTPERLIVREHIMKRKTAKLIRPLSLEL